MADTPNEAPAAPAESVATPNTNETASTEAPKMPDMHGFTSEDLANMRKFFDNNGGFEGVKNKISNPAPAPAQQPEQKTEEPAQPVQPAKPVYQAPAGSITAQEFLAKQYFNSLAQEEKYASIAKEIAGGEILKEMSSFNISPMDENGNINDAMVRRYLDLKAQTVPAKQSGATPEASAAPTVEYIPVGENITDLKQAYDVIRQDALYKSRGIAGHPSAAKAEEFIKNELNKGRK